MKPPEAFAPSDVGACQGSCRLSYAAEAVSFSSASAALTTDSRSGLSVTAPMGCQLRVCRAQRRGLAARASRYSACRRASGACQRSCRLSYAAARVI